MAEAKADHRTFDFSIRQRAQELSGLGLPSETTYQIRTKSRGR